MTKAKSIRGIDVDFDLFDIRQTIADTPKPEDVVLRERFINKKRRRNPSGELVNVQAEQERNRLMVQEALAKQKKASEKATVEESPKAGLSDTPSAHTNETDVKVPKKKKTKRTVIKK